MSKTGRNKTNEVEDQLNAVTVLDPDDPVYDSEFEGDDCFYQVIDVSADDHRTGLNRASSYSAGQALPSSLQKFPEEEYRSKISSIIDEFLSGGGDSSLFESLKDLDYKVGHDYFVFELFRKAASLNTARQTEMDLALCVLKSRGIISTAQVNRAFEKLVQSSEDIKLDIPNFVPIFVTTVSHMIREGVISEAFLDRLPLTVCREAATADSSLEPKLRRLQLFKADLKKRGPDLLKSRDPAELKKLVEDTDCDGLLHELILSLVRESLEQSDRERETAVQLLDAVYGSIFCADDVQIAFSRLLAISEDLQLDTPDVVTILAKFMGRCVVDELLPPAFLLDQYRLHIGGVTGMSALRKAQKWLALSKGKNRALQFQKIFTGTDPTTIEAKMFKHKLKDAICEYNDSRDEKEFARIIKSLSLTQDQSVEVVRKLIVNSMETKLHHEFLSALRLLQENEEVDIDIIAAGFLQTHARLDDIALDVPFAPTMLKYLAKEACAVDLLPDEIVSKLN